MDSDLVIGGPAIADLIGYNERDLPELKGMRGLPIIKRGGATSPWVGVRADLKAWAADDVRKRLNGE